MAYKSIRNFSINFTAGVFGSINVEQFVANGTQVEHDWVSASGSTTAGMNGGSTTFENGDQTYSVTVTFPLDNRDARLLSDIRNFGKVNGLIVGEFVLNDKDRGLIAESSGAYIETSDPDQMSSEGGERTFTFILPDAIVS